MVELDPDLLIGNETSDHLAIWLLGRLHPLATDYWDGNWLAAPIELIAGQFRAKVGAALRVDELRRFREGLERLNAENRGEAALETIEGWVDLRVVVSSVGALNISGTLTDLPGTGNVLGFKLASDLHLGDLHRLIGALRAIEEQFPLIGHP